VRGRGCGCEVGLCDGGGRELWGCLLVMVRRQGMDSENGEVEIEEWWWNCVWVTHVDVSVHDFPGGGAGDFHAVYCCGCVGHVWNSSQ
jgi:hypothetical protein